MCGRYTLRTDSRRVADSFGVADVPLFAPRYNIAPTQPVVAVRADPGGGRAALLLRWGLVPHWADDPAIGNRLINARAETVAEKPSFRAALKSRRCLIPADGFYEWQKLGKLKQPYLIGVGDGGPFAFAGLWEDWKRDGEIIESCTILTTAANELMRPLHERMPVILKPEDHDLWLDPGVKEAARVLPLLRPYPAAEMFAHPVSRWVNDPKHEGPQCVERAG